MHYLIQRYLSGKAKLERNPPTLVTTEEIINLLVTSGKTKAEASKTATVSKRLGSSIEIDNKMYSIKDDT